jgi:flagellar basal-body rod modification protein FlgD
MAVDAVSTGSSPNGVNKFAQLSSESFVRIMTAELTSQDPLKPNDSNQILQQMSSLRQIESSTSLTTKLDQLVGQNQFAAASSLLGAAISGVAENGTRQAGIAVSIVRTDKGASLVLDTGYRIPVNNIDTVDVPVAPDPTPNTPTPTSHTPTAAPVTVPTVPTPAIPSNEQSVPPVASGSGGGVQ